MIVRTLELARIYREAEVKQGFAQEERGLWRPNETVKVPQFNQAEGIFEVVTFIDKLLGKYRKGYFLGEAQIFTRRGLDFVRRELRIDFTNLGEAVFLNNVGGELHKLADRVKGGVVRDDQLRQRIDNYAHWLTIVTRSC